MKALFRTGYRALRAFCRKSLQAIGRINRDTRIMFKQFYHSIKIAWICYFKKKESKCIFFILCQCRTGSSLLVSYLNSVPGVFCNGEILSYVKPYGIRRWWVSKKMVFRHIRHSFNYRNEKTCGVKLIFEHLKQLNLSFEELICEFPGVQRIILYRKNILEQFLSQKIANRTRVWSLYEKSSPPDNIQIDFEPREALHYRDWVKAHYQKAQEVLKSRERSLWISYEELVKDPQTLFNEKIFPFLKLPQHRIKTDMIKQNRRPISEIISNYDTVRNMIEQTDFTYGENFVT